MRLIIIFICFLAFTSVLGQKPSLYNLWVGDADNYLRVDSDAVRVECSSELEGKRYVSQHAYRYSVIGDTLRILKPYYYDSSNHDFIINSLSTDELKLTPLNTYSRIFCVADTLKKVLSFRDQQKIYTDTINFQKVLFSSTTCYGICPAMSFQIDNKKLMKFSGDKFAIKQGFYTAVLSDELYSELLKILAISELDKLENLGQFNIDASTYTLEVHYNNKIKFIKSFRFPYVASELVNFLLEMPKRVELKKAEHMEISFSQ
jgi:hypothetical protein